MTDSKLTARRRTAQTSAHIRPVVASERDADASAPTDVSRRFLRLDVFSGLSQTPNDALSEAYRRP